MAGHLQLLAEPVVVDRAFEEACEWSETITLATPVAASSAGAWPTWRALERNAFKVAAAYIAIDGLRSEPAALDWFQNHGCLRFIPAADGSFRANVYQFKRGDELRVLMGPGHLGPAGLMAAVDATVLWAGSELDPFAASIDALLRRVREAAHVPSSEELANYSRVFYAGVALRDQLAELGAPFIRSTSYDADMPELELVVDAKTTRTAMKSIQDQLVGVATDKRRQKVGFHGGSGMYTLHWCAPLKLWVFFQKLDNRYWNAFGVTRPDPDKSLQITVEVNPPLEGIERKMGGAFARDPGTGDLYLVHRGRIGGGQKGIGAELFWSRFRGGVSMREPDRDEPSRVVVVGKVGAPEFARDVAGFVHEVRRIKAAAT